MARFELATSSLPRKHTARLCHIGTHSLSCPFEPEQKSDCLITFVVIPIKHCGTRGRISRFSRRRYRATTQAQRTPRSQGFQHPYALQRAFERGDLDDGRDAAPPDRCNDIGEFDGSRPGGLVAVGRPVVVVEVVVARGDAEELRKAVVLVRMPDVEGEAAVANKRDLLRAFEQEVVPVAHVLERERDGELGGERL